MKSFYRMLTILLVGIILMFLCFNLLLLDSDTAESGRPYRVEINRIVLAIEEDGLDQVDLSSCAYVTAVTRNIGDSSAFYDTNSNYAIREIDGDLYRFDYCMPVGHHRQLQFWINLMLGIFSAGSLVLLFFIHRRILLPFARLNEISCELAKGNLTVPVEENKNRFFGKFLWGMNLLRENLEEQKQRELLLQKEKKTLLLSLSHDIKTPLSAIKLYARALSKELYPEKEKQLEVAEKISEKADEIERFLAEIIQTSREDFLSLEVRNGEFYLSELVHQIETYYAEKLSLVHTAFFVGSYRDCVLNGDRDRCVEVLQNIMENAVKYGDGHAISLSFSEEDGCQLITVENSGCTLSKLEMPHIFDSFWRGSNADVENGIGLGLYICRQLMHMMHGEVFAEMHDGIMRVTAVFVRA